jgi:hypothetical protein
MKMKRFLFLFVLCLQFLIAYIGFARKNPPSRPQRQSPMQSLTQDAPVLGGVQRSIEVRGQSRNLNMTLLLNNRTEAIRFVEPRKQYTNEIISTVY